MTLEVLRMRWDRYLELAETMALDESADARAAALAVHADAIRACDHYAPGTPERSLCTRAAARAWHIAAQLGPKLTN